MSIKKKLLEQLIERVKEETALAEEAALHAQSYKQDESMKQEGKYDTRSVEAGYLAGAQVRRVEELKLELQMLEEIPIHDFDDDDDIAIGALVSIKFKNQVRDYFVSSTAGGTIVNVDGNSILVISVFSPIGQAVIGLNKGNEFEVETPQETRVYEIVAVQ